MSGMRVAVLGGELLLGEIESKARRYGNRVLDRFASKFGPCSLDQELGRVHADGHACRPIILKLAGGDGRDCLVTAG